MNQEVLSQYDVMTVGEMPGATVEDAKLYTSEAREELQMVFQFEHVDIDSGPSGKWEVTPWTLPRLRDILHKWQVGLAQEGWNSLYLNNHDQPRMVSRFGNDGEYRVQSAKMLATLLHTLKGTPYIYQGEEIGMTNVRFEKLDDYRDIEILNMYREKVTEGGAKHEDIIEGIYAKGRDNARTPMQWNAAENAGFTEGTPWIGVNPNYREINVEQALKDPNSIFHYYKKLIALRKENPVMVYGDYELLLEDHDSIYAFTRTLGEVQWLTVLNFFGKEVRLELPEQLQVEGKPVIIGNYPEERLEAGLLRPYEARVYRMH